VLSCTKNRHELQVSLGKIKLQLYSSLHLIDIVVYAQMFITSEYALDETTENNYLNPPIVSNAEALCSDADESQ